MRGVGTVYDFDFPGFSRLLLKETRDYWLMEVERGVSCETILLGALADEPSKLTVDGVRVLVVRGWARGSPQGMAVACVENGLLIVVTPDYARVTDLRNHINVRGDGVRGWGLELGRVLAGLPELGVGGLRIILADLLATWVVLMPFSWTSWYLGDDEIVWPQVARILKHVETMVSAGVGVPEITRMLAEYAGRANSLGGVGERLEHVIRMLEVTQTQLTIAALAETETTRAPVTLELEGVIV